MRADGTIDRLSKRWLGVSYQMSTRDRARRRSNKHHVRSEPRPSPPSRWPRVPRHRHAQADDSLARLQKKGVVLVANTQESPPWSYLDDDNEAAGYDVAVAREIFKRLGVAKVEFVADKFKNFIDGINAKKYDVVVNSLARTPERAKVVDFTVPYTVQDFRIWVHAATPTSRTPPR
jgi:ABC-type amino acid transport substrate-binding protein